MSKSYTSLIGIIVSKLKNLKVDDKTIFYDVYDSPEIEPNGYPCVFVLDDAGEGSILDTARNEREWQFRVILMQEAKYKTPQQMTAILRSIVDKTIKMFDQDPQLEVGGEAKCQYIKVVPLTFDYKIKEQPWAFAEFIISAVDIVRNHP